jgi:hypothetical protein
MILVTRGTDAKLTPITDKIPEPHWYLVRGMGKPVTWMNVVMPQMMSAA